MPPPPPAAWLEACPSIVALPTDRQIEAGEAWGAVFGERGLIAAWRCEGDRRGCLRRWYAEELWRRPADVAACTGALERPRADAGAPIS